jgi:hypothetical protein
MYDFTKTMGILNGIYLEDQEFLPNIFWKTIDNLPNEELFDWVERMLSMQSLLLGKDYLRVVGIQHDYRQFKKWTKKQKRSIAMDLIKHWNEVEERYEP